MRSCVNNIVWTDMYMNTTGMTFIIIEERYKKDKFIYISKWIK